MTERQHRNSRLTRFQDFIKRPPVKEAFAINTSGASFITLDGSAPAEERQRVIDEFGDDLNKLSNDGHLVIAMAVALD